MKLSIQIATANTSENHFTKFNTRQSYPLYGMLNQFIMHKDQN